MFLQKAPFSTEKLQGTIISIKRYTLILKGEIAQLKKF